MVLVWYFGHFGSKATLMGLFCSLTDGGMVVRGNPSISTIPLVRCGIKEELLRIISLRMRRKADLTSIGGHRWFRGAERMMNVRSKE